MQKTAFIVAVVLAFLIGGSAATENLALSIGAGLVAFLTLLAVLKQKRFLRKTILRSLAKR